MVKRNVDLLLVSGGAVAGVLAQTIGLPAGLRLALGVPLLLLWPGYALTAAFFPRWVLGWAERLIFSLGLSLMSVIVGAVILNWSASGLTAAAWAVLGSALTLTGALVALWRRRHMLPEPGPLPILRPAHLALFVLAAVLTVGAVGLSRISVYPADVQGYTLLWLTPNTGGSTSNIRLSIRSAELTPQSYRLVLTASGVKVAEWSDVTLSPGQIWETTAVMAERPTADTHFEARLYRNEEPGTVYRRVSWWGAE
jgi:hypothetical protein